MKIERHEPTGSRNHDEAGRRAGSPVRRGAAVERHLGSLERTRDVNVGGLVSNRKGVRSREGKRAPQAIQGAGACRSGSERQIELRVTRQIRALRRRLQDGARVQPIELELPVEAEIGRLEIGGQFAARVTGLRLHVHVERHAVDRAGTFDVESRRQRVSIERGNDSPDLRQSRRARSGDLQHRLVQVSFDHTADCHVAFSRTNAHLLQVQIVVTNGQCARQLLQCQVRRGPVEADILERHAVVNGLVEKTAFDVKAIDL